MEHLGPHISAISGLQVELAFRREDLAPPSDQLESFHTFPKRNGWIISDNGEYWERKCPIHQRETAPLRVCHDQSCAHIEEWEVPDWARLGAFIQRWLFFEVLKEFFYEDLPDHFNFNHFLKDRAPPQQPIITTADLNDYLKRWEESQDRMVQRRLKARLIRLQQVLDHSRRLVSKYCSVDYPETKAKPPRGLHRSIFGSYWPVDPAISLSVMVLGEALTHTFVRVVDHIGLMPKGWFYDDDYTKYRGYGYSSLVKDLLHNKSNWCQRTVKMLETLLQGNTTGLLVALPHTLNSGEHFACQPKFCCARQTDAELRKLQKELSENPSLQKIQCRGSEAKEGPSHLPKAQAHNCDRTKPNKTCSTRNADLSELRACINDPSNDCVPLFQWDNKNRRVHVRKMVDWDTPYVIFSHVWGDGYGNKKENAMYECVLRTLNKLCEDVWERAEGKSWRGKTTPDSFFFWIDTLGLPTGPSSEDHEAKRKAIGRIHNLYKNADFTLVFENDLMSEKLEEGKHNLGAIRISISRWMSRLWTLQEGVLSKKLYFNFNDRLWSLEEIEEKMELDEHVFGRSPHRCVSRLSKLYTEGLLGQNKDFLQQLKSPDGTIPPASRHVVASVWRAVQWRRISKLKDLPLALAILFGLSTETIVSYDNSEDDFEIEDPEYVRRMCELYRLLGATEPCAIPPGMIFLPGPKLAVDGFRWAPANWLLDDDALFPDPLDHKILEPALIGNNHTHKGLEVVFPGFFLHKLPESDEHFTDSGLIIPGKDRFSFPVDKELNDWYEIRQIDGRLFPPLTPEEQQKRAIITMGVKGRFNKEVALLVVVKHAQTIVNRAKSLPDHPDKSDHCKRYVVDIVSRVKLRQITKTGRLDSLRHAFRTHNLGNEVCGEALRVPQFWLVDGYVSPRDLQARPPVQALPDPIFDTPARAGTVDIAAFPQLSSEPDEYILDTPSATDRPTARRISRLANIAPVQRSNTITAVTGFFSSLFTGNATGAKNQAQVTEQQGLVSSTPPVVAGR